MQEPDPQIVEAARRGDQQAFAWLVRAYQGDIWRLSLHLLRSPTAADDVTQEAFLRAFRFLPRYRGDARFTTWLFSIARNCALDELRRGARRKRLLERTSAEGPPAKGDPQVAIEVREALAELTLELREPVVLIDMFGLSYRETAEVLEIPEGTVKSRVHRARELLVSALSAGSQEGRDEA